MDEASWRRLATHLGEVERRVAQHGLTLALHPHVGTQIETAEDVQRALAVSDAGWCLDTGHLLIGGADPAEFVRANGDRIVHAHLKDVDAGIAQRLRAGELTLVEATQAGLFRPLGRGDVRIDEVVDLLHAAGYGRWLVLEQDTAITGEEPPVGRGPVIDVRTSIDYLHPPAPARRERVAES
jgi:inosose dehydratase